jgi:hypothetical protein
VPVDGDRDLVPRLAENAAHVVAQIGVVVDHQHPTGDVSGRQSGRRFGRIQQGRRLVLFDVGKRVRGGDPAPRGIDMR